MKPRKEVREVDIPILTTEELKEIKSCLYSFVSRVSSWTGEKTPEEVKILPAMTELLFRFSD